MAITTVVAGGTNKFRAIEITITKPANGVIGPGGVVLTHGKQVRVSEGHQGSGLAEAVAACAAQVQGVSQDPDGAAVAAQGEVCAGHVPLHLRRSREVAGGAGGFQRAAVARQGVLGEAGADQEGAGGDGEAPGLDRIIEA